jgi:hypothetical protein
MERNVARTFRQSAHYRAAIGQGVARRAAVRRASVNALAAAVDLIAETLITERGQQIADRLLRRLRYARKPLTLNALVGSASPFSVPHPTAVVAALVERGDIVITDTHHYKLGKRD